MLFLQTVARKVPGKRGKCQPNAPTAAKRGKERCTDKRSRCQRLTRALSTIARLSSSRLPPLPLHLLFPLYSVSLPPFFSLSPHLCFSNLNRASFSVLYTLDPSFHLRHSWTILCLIRLSHFVFISSSPPHFQPNSLSADSVPSFSTNHAITTSSSPLHSSITISTPTSVLQSTHFSPRAIFSPPNKLSPSPIFRFLLSRSFLSSLPSLFCTPDIESDTTHPSSRVFSSPHFVHHTRERRHIHNHVPEHNNI